jgi:hypothetical protein
VNNEPQSSDQPVKQNFSRGIWARIAVVMLLIGVAGLSTLAKNGQYFSKTSPARHVSISTKMDVGHTPAVFTVAVPQPAIKVIPPQPRIAIGRVNHLPVIPTLQIGIAVSMQHRAPPSLS